MEEKKNKLRIYIKLLIFCFLCLFVLITIPFSKFFNSKLNKINIENYVDFNYVLDKDCSVSVLDVGCAECVALKLPDGKKALFDFGVDTNNGVSNMYKEKSMSYLKNLFKDDELVFDFVVLTHPDADHYNNFEYVFDEFQINKVYRPAVFYSNESHITETNEELERAKQAEFLNEDKTDFGDELYTISTDLYRKFLNKIYAEPNCEYEYTFVKSGFLTITSNDESKPYTITFYSPYKLKYNNNNAFSVVAILEYNNHRVCLTGDATEEVERYLCTNIDLEAVDVLTVAHHGSNTSSTQEFLNKLKPKYAFVSVNSKTNNYNLPRKEVIQRLEISGVETKNIFQTQNCGDLVFAIDEGGVYISSTGNIVPQKFKWWHVCLCVIVVGGIVIFIIKPPKKVKFKKTR